LSPKHINLWQASATLNDLELKIRHTLLVCTSVVLAAFGSESADADDAATVKNDVQPVILASGKRISAVRFHSAPDIDGSVSEAEWQRAVQFTDLHEVQPIEFSEPSERTQWFIGYDSNALYVAAKAYDSSPQSIVARTLRQGASLRSDDSLHILIDAFNNKRSGYTFALNANGVRYDAIYTNGTRESDDWEGVWRGASSLTDDGWQMEMAIPFNTITFDPDNETWGINFWREIARRNEKVAWESRNGEINPTVSGEIDGFRELSQGVGLDVIPSTSVVANKDRIAGTSSSEIRPSLDINYKLTPSVSALLTINTDFAATEVDGRQLDLQRFSLFFPEKRSFFLTDFDIFQFGGVPTGGGFNAAIVGTRSGTNGLAFFSRRIGLSSDRQPVDISVGSKISGRIGRFDIGTLYIRQEEFGTVDASDLMVARVSRGVLAESALGAIYTNGDPASNADSSLAGVDFLYRNTRLGNNRTMEGNFWIQQSDNEGIDSDDIAWNATLGFPAREGLEAGVQVQEVRENFQPALGFANRTGVRLRGGEAGYRHLIRDHFLIEEVRHNLEYSRWEYLDTGFVQSEELQIVPVSFRSNSGDFGRIDFKAQKEGLLPGEQPLESLGILIPEGEYDFDRWGIFLRSARHRALGLQLRVDDGGFFNGDRFRVRPEIDWAPSEHLRFSLEYEFNRYKFPGASAITRQISLENEIAFNSRLSLVTLAQYDNVSDDIGINARVRYNIAAGRDLWFVVNHNMSRDPLNDQNRFDRFRSTESFAVAKIRYTFRY